MTNTFRNAIPNLLLAIVALALNVSTLEAIDEKGLSRRSSRIAKGLDNLQAESSSRIPADILKQAKGIIILQQYEAGFVFGGKGGYGIAILRDDDNNWGTPAWLKTGEGSWGLQAGVQKLNVAFLLMDRKALRMLTKAKFRIGVDAAATFGPDGTNVEANFGTRAPVLVYAIAEGLYAGASFEGGFLVPDNKSNEATYGAEHSLKDITANDILETPELFDELIAKLVAIENCGDH